MKSATPQIAGGEQGRKSTLDGRRGGPDVESMNSAATIGEGPKRSRSKHRQPVASSTAGTSVSKVAPSSLGLRRHRTPGLPDAWKHASYLDRRCKSDKHATVSWKAAALQCGLVGYLTGTRRHGH